MDVVVVLPSEMRQKMTEGEGGTRMGNSGGGEGGRKWCSVGE